MSIGRALLGIHQGRYGHISLIALVSSPSLHWPCSIWHFSSEMRGNWCLRIQLHPLVQIWTNYSRTSALDPWAFVSQLSTIPTHPSSFQSYFFRLLISVEVWKNLVFLSRNRSQLTLDFCIHKSSSWCIVSFRSLPNFSSLRSPG